jgi:hypothetical protein
MNTTVNTKLMLSQLEDIVSNWKYVQEVYYDAIGGFLSPSDVSWGRNGQRYFLCVSGDTEFHIPTYSENTRTFRIVKGGVCSGKIKISALEKMLEQYNMLK